METTISLEKIELPQPKPRPVSRWQRLKIQWSAWEFWPMSVTAIPLGAIWAWYALRARHPFFFSNVNPAIPLGGFCGESKMDILRLLPPEILPKTAFLPAEMPFFEKIKMVESAGIGFPLVAKPDVGERGFLIKKCHTEAELQAHLDRYPIAFIVQEFLPQPREMTVLFHRFSDGRFGITSVCEKGFLRVVGDGFSSVRELMLKNSRAILQVERFEKEFPKLLEKVPAEGEPLLLEPIGNHCRGTAFLDANLHIDKGLNEIFEQVCQQIPGIRYGRFDLKCDSPEALKSGDFKVMELNGVLGEPAHIYDPKHSFWYSVRETYRHWSIIFRLHREQKKLGIEPTPLREGISMIRSYLAYKKRCGQF